MRFIAVLLLAALSGACGTGDADETAVQGAAPVSEPTAAVPTSEWPQSGPADVRRERRFELTGAAPEETVIVTARGPRHDSLRIALAIVSASGDTLWYDEWDSMHYFAYTPISSMEDTAAARVVREHVADLLADDRFSAQGMPTRLSASDDMIRESVRYHLAELDWRGGADLRPSDATPPGAHDRIDASRVVVQRADVVISELRGKPVYWYYAGGEETYAIAWSDREHAFVRLYSCC